MSKPRVTGTSTLTNRKGEVVAKWTKEQVARNIAEEMRQLSNSIPSLVLPRSPIKPPSTKDLCADLLSTYVLGDLHWGLLCWEGDSARNWDMKAAERRVVNSIKHLVAQGPKTERALLVSLGDYFHIDDGRAETPKSKNRLDVDSRYPKVLREGLRVLIETIKALLAKHQLVGVILVAGNHDPHLTPVLRLMVEAYFRDEPRVKIDTGSKKHHYFTWGQNLIGATHGDTGKHADLPGIMATDQPELWGRARHRLWMCGHIHHVKRQEYRGCTVETFRSPAPRDAWHDAYGYRSGNDVTKIIFHREHGELSRFSIPGEMADEL